MEARLRALCSRWHSFLLVGFFLLILGTLALSSLVVTTVAAAIFYGAIMAASGLALIIHAFWTRSWSGFFTQLLVGILGASIGWLMLIHPLIGAASLTLLLATFFIASGLFKIAGALMHNLEHWGWFLFNGIVTLALGIIILSQWPQASLWLLGLLIAVDLLVAGWTNVIIALRLRGSCKQDAKSHTPEPRAA